MSQLGQRTIPFFPSPLMRGNTSCFIKDWASGRPFWRVREFDCVLGARFHAAVFLDGPFLSLLLSSPLSLSPTDAAVPALLPGYWIYCIWLRSGCALPFLPALPVPSLCLPSVWGASLSPSRSPFFPAVGLGIKIRHFIVSKFCEADNIAAPIAAPPPPLPPRERGNPSVLVLLPHK